MKARSKDRRITWLTYSVEVDEYGDRYGAWTPTGDRWAEVERTADDEAQAMQTDVKYRLKLRINWRETIATEDRLIYRGRTFEISSLEEIGRKEGWRIVAEEAPDGPRQQ